MFFLLVLLLLVGLASWPGATAAAAPEEEGKATDSAVNASSSSPVNHNATAKATTTPLPPAAPSAGSASPLQPGAISVKQQATDAATAKPMAVAEEEEEEEDAESEEEDSNEEEESDSEEEEDEEEEEEEDEPAYQKQRGVAAAHPYRVGQKQSLMARLVSKTLNFTSSSAAQNVTTPAGPTARTVKALRAVPPKQLASLGLKVLVLGGLLYSLRHVLTFKTTMQALMIISIMAEIAGRLGLLKDLKLPSPFPSAMGSSRLQLRGPPVFTFEVMNNRFMTDRVRLSLLTGDTTGQALVAAATARKAAAAEAAKMNAAAGAGAGAGGGGGNGTMSETRHTTAFGTAPKNATAAAAAAPATSNQTTAAAAAAPAPPRPRLYVVQVKGDMMLSQGPYITQIISFLLETARPGPAGDELVLLLESGGGAAYEYGLASSQLERLRRAGIRLTVCVDKVAASGGYMMAVVADTLVAAPFATIGSIGATTSVPILNVGGVLKRLGIQAYTVKSGKHKGSGGMLLVGDAKGDQEALAKLQEDLGKVHEAFKAHIAKWRGMVDVEKVGTGEVWQGREAKALGLVDDVMTSDEYVAKRLLTHDIIKVTPAPDVRRFLSLLPSRPGGGGLPVGASLAGTLARGWLTQGRGAAARRRIGVAAVEGGEEEEGVVEMLGGLATKALLWLLGRPQPPVFC